MTTKPSLKHGMTHEIELIPELIRIKCDWVVLINQLGSKLTLVYNHTLLTTNEIVSYRICQGYPDN